GFNVYPKEIESEIDAIDGVVESAVIGLPHADFGEGVTAVVVPSKGATLDEVAILHGLDGRLAKFKMPKRVLFEDDLPRNTMGKVQKNVLRDKYKTLYQS
ncbi:MAG: malonyl-CoA synthase, partial [Rhizobiales bacterium]|nr:malonyl-CoA synthase [Hyphomicrobiales bacterium]